MRSRARVPLPALRSGGLATRPGRVSRAVRKGRPLCFTPRAPAGAYGAAAFRAPSNSTSAARPAGRARTPRTAPLPAAAVAAPDRSTTAHRLSAAMPQPPACASPAHSSADGSSPAHGDASQAPAPRFGAGGRAASRTPPGSQRASAPTRPVASARRTRRSSSSPCTQDGRYLPTSLVATPPTPQPPRRDPTARGGAYSVGYGAPSVTT